MSLGARLPLALLVGTAAIFVWSGVEPYSRITWLLEVFPVLLGAPLLYLTWRRFPLTHLVYALIFVHAAILMIGGHYTYARTPIGFWLQDLFGFARNHYDRIGHLAQGFIPALIARELLLRQTALRPGGWLNFLVLSVCLAISVFYEFIEWWASLLSGSAADDFLATQGDIWDTQWDMFLAGLGAVAALLLLSRLHDRQLAIRSVGERSAPTD